MKNKINAIIILLSIALLAFVASRGLKIGEFQILSIAGLIEKNDSLNQKIDKATKLTSLDYPQEEENLEESFERYKIQKQKYEQLLGATGDNDGESYETKQYDISYLWRVLGKYAEKRKLTLGIEVTKQKNTQSSYTLNFNVSGQYTNIIRFITDIENDSDLYFRIYNFSMSGNGTNITANFAVKNINIDSSTIL